ncbi:hypothetical protein HBB16_01985 [Pseudonocardia sp. MCCB 268]|nr:hypothetical protein [Pseudonocardia cytotoxica]
MILGRRRRRSVDGGGRPLGRFRGCSSSESVYLAAVPQGGVVTGAVDSVCSRLFNLSNT